MDQNDYSRSRALNLLETILERIKTSLASGQDVMISGLGKFFVNRKAERKGRNPATAESMMLEQRKLVIFKCSGKLLEKINNGI